MSEIKTCLDCGKSKSKKGNYCKKCGYKHRTRPSGLTYKIVKENPTSFKKGDKPWNTGTTGICKPNSGSFRKGQRPSTATEFQKGQKSWNYNGGLPMCLECGKRLSNYSSKRCTDCKRVTISGENHYLWKGGVSKFYKERKGSREHKEWRESVFERDDYTCQDCGLRGVYLEAHHIKEWANYPDSRFDIDNGQTLCRPCHLQTPNFGIKAIA